MIACKARQVRNSSADRLTRARRGASAAGVLALLIASPAWAQDARPAPTPTKNATSTAEDGQIDDVVVTANKREERIQDVAAAVSAVSGAELARTQTLDLQDLQVRVPGLRLFSSGGPQARIIIRGQNSGGDGATVVSILDDVPLGFSSANNGGGFVVTDFDTYDLQRVEVLRGPQGTLYGATAEAGLIKYVTNAPKLGQIKSGFDVSIFGVERAGDVGGTARAFVNVPLSSTLAFRANGFLEQQPGFIDNSFTRENGVNSVRRYGGRAQLLWKPTDNFTARATAYIQQRDGRGVDQIAVQGGAGANALQPVNGYDAPAYFNPAYNSRYELYYLNLDYDAGGLRLQSITSYGTAATTLTADRPSLTPIISLIAGQQATARFTNTIPVDKFSQELRIASPMARNGESKTFEWQLGVFYTSEKIRYAIATDAVTIPGLVRISGAAPQGPFGLPGDLIGTVIDARIAARYESLAGYADAIVRLTRWFDIELGGRVEANWQRSQTTANGLQFVLGGQPATNIAPTLRTSETVFTYSVAPRIHFSADIIAYGRIAKGYRPGGPQVPLPGEPASLPTSFRSDSTVNYEIGLKGSAFGRLLSFDLAAFRIDWTDIQLSQIVVVAGQPYSRTGNGGRARSEGIEWSFELRPMRGLSLTWLGAYTNARLTQDAPGVGGLAGDKLNFVPDYTSTLGGLYETPIGRDFTMFVGGDWARVSQRRVGVSGTGVLDLPSFDQFNAQIGMRKGPFTAQIFAKNLSNERGFSSYTPTSFGAPAGALGAAAIIRPRTVGLRVAAAF